MAVPASGQITYDEINVEVGNASGSEASMDQMTIDHWPFDAVIDAVPDEITDWYGFEQGPIPDPPTGVGLLYNPKTDIFTITWTDASNNEDGFEVQLWYDPGVGYEACCTTGANIETCECSPTGPCPETYTARVRSQNGAGESAWAYSGDKAC